MNNPESESSPASKRPRLIAPSERKKRLLKAHQFRSDYIYGTATVVEGCKKGLGHSKERKTCIWSSGSDFWSCKSSGIMWVAVHGMDSICVVTRDEKLDKTRLGSLLSCKSEMEVLHLFRETVISEIEDIEDPSGAFHELSYRNSDIMKPFAVVSATQGIDKVHAECSHEASSIANFDVAKAIEFLKEKMQSGLAFTYNETIQTAISAFQQLFPKNSNAQEIKVCTWKEGEIALELQWSDIMKLL